MPLVLELRDRIAKYLAGETTLDEFQRWFAPVAWGLDPERDSVNGDVATQIELWLAEYLNGHRTELDLSTLMRPLVEKYVVVLIPRALKTGVMNETLHSPVALTGWTPLVGRRPAGVSA